jgi:hypothetical protein
MPVHAMTIRSSVTFALMVLTVGLVAAGQQPSQGPAVWSAPGRRAPAGAACADDSRLQTPIDAGGAAAPGPAREVSRDRCARASTESHVRGRIRPGREGDGRLEPALDGLCRQRQLQRPAGGHSRRHQEQSGARSHDRVHEHPGFARSVPVTAARPRPNSRPT